QHHAWPDSHSPVMCDQTSPRKGAMPMSHDHDAAPAGAPALHTFAAQPGSPAAVLPSGRNEPCGSSAAVPGTSQLQDVLPEIKDLAQRVGGMERLCEIVMTLKEAKQ